MALAERQRPDLNDNDVDRDVWSNWASSGTDGTLQRMTWREVAEMHLLELVNLRPLATLLSDLDRCEHGRHSSDDCYGCEGRSTGNLHARPGERIGTDLAGRPIVVPDARQLTEASAWIVALLADQ